MAPAEQAQERDDSKGEGVLNRKAVFFVCVLRWTVGRAGGEGGIMEQRRRDEDLGQAGQMLPRSPGGDSADYPA